MAVWTCKDCGGQVSSSAPACPHCGRKMGNPLPKPVLGCLTLFLIAAAMSALMGGRGGSGSTPAGVSPTNAITETVSASSPPAWKLASADVGSAAVPRNVLVAYEAVMAELKAKCPEGEEEIAQGVTAALRAVGARGAKATGAELLAAMNSAISPDPAARKGVTCADVAAWHAANWRGSSPADVPTAAPEVERRRAQSGVLLVGSDIGSGTFRTRTASVGCYWARLAGTGGEIGEILANDNSDGPEVVTIGPKDAAFETHRCSEWSADLSAITPGRTSPFGAGTYIVNVDIEPGVWRADSPESCYWARLRGFSGGMRDLISNNNGGGTVTIRATDKGFKSSRCGLWRKIK